MKKLDKEQLKYLFNRMNTKLEEINQIGELLICGGALMSLVYNRTELTEDIDGIFRPKDILEEIIKEIAKEENLSEDWLNDNVKEYLDLVKLGTELILDLSNLTVKGVSLPVLLGMKLMAFRHNKDNSDIFNLVIRYGVFDWDLLIENLSKYVPKDRILVSKILLQSMFRNYTKEDLIKKHYSYIYDNDSIVDCLTDIVITYYCNYCPIAKNILSEKAVDKAMEGKLLYLKKLIESDKRLKEV